MSLQIPVFSRPLTRNGSVGNPCALHSGQCVWHNSSCCPVSWRIGRRRLDYQTQNDLILAATQFKERQRVAEEATESEKQGRPP